MKNKKRYHSESEISQKENVSKVKKSTDNRINTKSGPNDDRYDVLFYASPVAMSLATIGEGKLIDVNQAWLDLVGIADKENVLGKTSVELGLIPDAGSREILLNEIKQHGSVKNAEIIANNSNGDRIFLLVNLKTVNIGGIQYLFSTNENITTIKLAEERLRYHAKLVDSVSDAIISTDNENIIRSWNRAAERVYGWSEEEVVGKKGSDLLQTEFPEGLSRELLLLELIEAGSWHGQLIQRTREGRTIFVEATSIALKDDSNESVGGISIVRDITEQKKAQNALIDAQRMMQSLINNTPAIVYALDLEGRFLLANTALADLLNTTPGAMIGKRRHEFMPEDDAYWHEANDGRVVKEGRPVEFEEYSHLKDRSITWLTTKFPLLDSQGRIYAVAGISNDISDRKKAQVKTETLLAEIQIEKERLATLINNIPDEVWIADLNKNFILMNSISRQKFGLNKDYIGIEEFTSSIEVLRPDYSPRPLEEAPALLALKGDIVNNLEEIIRIPASGELRHRQVNASPVKDASGKIIGSISIVRDITERKSMEQQLRFHSDILQSVADAVIVTDTSYNITSWNKPAEQMYGWVAEEVLGRFIREIVQTQTDGKKLTQIYQTVSEGKQIVTEHVQKTKDGSLIIVECNSMPLLDSKEKIIGYVTINRNITERKKAEIKLIERDAQLIELNNTKDKFFNIVAHDLKNPFTSILGSSELLYGKINDMNPENIKKLVLIINDSAKAGYSILLNLLNWSRSQTGMLMVLPEKVNLKNIVDENIDNHQLTAYNKDITIINETRDNLHIISDKNILNTVLRNLLSNAIKYTHRNGKVVVRFKANLETVTILVTDNGVGISQEKIGTLFKLERAYSLPGTENEIGTGLGLKLCKELIEKLGGIISVESEYGKGSTFLFTIPKKGIQTTH